MITIHMEPDAAIEPGHQHLVLPFTEDGRALVRLLTGDDFLWRYLSGAELRIPHDETVDARIVTLIDLLAHVRYSAPVLVQLSMIADASQPAFQGEELE